MKNTLTESDFIHGFTGIYRDTFSYYGRRALWEWLSQLEEDTGEEIEFDSVALCCKFTEYENLAELNQAYDENFISLDEVSDKTIVIWVGGESFIIQDYYP